MDCVRISFSRLALASLACMVSVVPAGAQPPTSPEPARHAPTPDQINQIRGATEKLGKTLDALKTRPPLDSSHSDDLIADIAVYHKAAAWTVERGEFFRPDTARSLLTLLQRGQARADEALQGRRPWLDARGSIIRGFVSRIDRSVQPYAIVVPGRPLEPDARYRLDVVLHGRDASLNEARFLDRHDGRPAEPDAPGLVLHVFGRGNNAFRWAGETDVFEAIEAVKRSYPVDERRIVLRGFSMGGAGAWHLGLHHPARWCVVEAGAGFTDTRRYLGRDDFTPVQRKLLHIYDAVDVALNASMVPIAGYGGELDKQLQASANVREALASLGFPMTTEGLVTRSEPIDFLQVVGAQTAHKVDPASETILKAFRDEHAAAGQSLDPKPLRFITYTLKYPSAPWLSVERLLTHYEPAVVEARPDPETDAVTIDRIENVAVIGIDRRAGETIRLGGQEFPLRNAVGGYLPRVYFRLVEDRWEMLDYEASRQLQNNDRLAKVPGLQGPIDDAFTGPFLCVRGAGQPWNPNVQAWADARLERFRTLWRRSLRGDLPVKDDTAVTAEDRSRFHLILFGDPGSNTLIREFLPQLPMSWTKSTIQVAEATAGASDHAPVLIALNPSNRHRYVVLNSGHTFGAEAFSGTNALLYPRVGDYALYRLNSAEGEVIDSGFFDEFWNRNPSTRLPAGELPRP